MELRLGTFPVESVAFGSPPGWSRGRLVVDPVRVRAIMLSDPRIRDVALDLVEPGEPARIVQVRDVIEPRVKVAGPGTSTQPSAGIHQIPWARASPFVIPDSACSSLPKRCRTSVAP